MSKKINIEMTEDDIRNMLIKKLNAGSCNEPLADLIIGHIEQTGSGLTQLFKGMLGIFPSLKYEVGDYVWIPIKNLPSWKVDLKATEELPGIRDKNIMVKITDVNPYKPSEYSIEADVIYDGKIAVVDYNIPESYIMFREESFLEILELIEQFKDEKKGEDVPF